MVTISTIANFPLYSMDHDTFEMLQNTRNSHFWGVFLEISSLTNAQVAEDIESPQPVLLGNGATLASTFTSSAESSAKLPKILFKKQIGNVAEMCWWKKEDGLEFLLARSKQQQLDQELSPACVCVLGTFPLSFERCISLSVCLNYNFLSVLSNHRIFQSFISGGARISSSAAERTVQRTQLYSDPRTVTV